MSIIVDFLLLLLTAVFYVVETAMAAAVYLAGQWWAWLALITISAAVWTASRNGTTPGGDSSTIDQ
jgi:uncharacterized integral membrane protein